MIPAASLIGSNVCVMPKPETSRCTFKQRRGEGWKRNFLPQPMSQGMTSPSVLPSTPPGSRFVDVHRHGVPLLPPHLPRAAQLSVRHCLSTSTERASSLPAPLCSQRSGLAADGRPSSTCPSPPYRHSFVYTVGVSPWCIAGAGLLCQHKLCRCRLHPCPGAALACRSILLRAQMGRQLAGTIPPSRSCSECVLWNQHRNARASARIPERLGAPLQRPLPLTPKPVVGAKRGLSWPLGCVR